MSEDTNLFPASHAGPEGEKRAVCHIVIKVNVMEPSKQAEPVVEPKVETKEPVVEKKVETVGQVLDPKPEPKVVPEAAFLELKRENKDFKKQIADLEKKIENGATKAEVSDDIAAIGEEFGVDKQFLTKLSGAIEKKFESKLAPINAKDKAEKIEKVFKTHFDKAMAEMPEFAGVVNRDTIKSLSLDPANADKTFQQLIEETYGNALGGKRTLETTTPRGGAKIDKVDFKRAANDQDYLAEVLKNPDTKKEYNEGLAQRLSTQF